MLSSVARLKAVARVVQVPTIPRPVMGSVDAQSGRFPGPQLSIFDSLKSLNQATNPSVSFHATPSKIHVETKQITRCRTY
jgi:hypothetical protein